MSTKEITITTEEGNVLGLLAFRKFDPGCQESNGFIKRKKRDASVNFFVQYGIGVAGEGKSLKAAIENFRENWSFMCKNMDAIVRGEVPGWGGY